jgi:hypothetical protein
MGKSSCVMEAGYAPLEAFGIEIEKTHDALFVLI